MENVDECLAEERVGRVDPYGFRRPQDFDYVSYERFMSDYLTVLTRRAIKWSKLLQRSKVEKSVKVKRYIRKGIPNEHRSLIWMIVSGAQAQMEKNPGYFRKLLEGEQDPKLVEAVKTDLNRTFPDNEYFRKNANPCFQRELFNVLVAYGNHNKIVGYCQIMGVTCSQTSLFNMEKWYTRAAWRSAFTLFHGMNFIAGYLIIVTKDEEKAFWLLDALVGKIIPDFYSPTMIGLKTDQEVLGELVKMKIPAVAALMDHHNVMWTLVVSRWFICLFIDILPVETVFRIWDCLFYEGSKIIFRVALTLIKHQQASILEANNFPDVCEKFKEITQGPLITDCHNFMQKIFREPGGLSLALITKLRESCRARILAQG